MLKKLKYNREYNQKLRKAKVRMHERQKEVIRKERQRRRQEWMKHFRHFLANPFRRRHLKADEKLRRYTLHHAREIHRKERRQKLRVFLQNPWKALFVREKSHEEILKEHWKKKDKKIAHRKRVLHRQETFHNILRPGGLQKRFGLTLLQSSTYYILSFLTVYILYQLITIGFAKGFHIPVIWNYYKLDFPLYTYSPLYTRKAMVVIFGIGPVFSLVLGLLSLRLFFSEKISSQNLRLFFLWGFVNGMNFFFGSYIAGFLTRADFIYASEWLFMSQMFDAEEIVFTADGPAAKRALTLTLKVDRRVRRALEGGSGGAYKP